MLFSTIKARKSFTLGAVHSHLSPNEAIADAITLEEISPCEIATQLHLSFMRMCSAVVEHAYELEVQNEFRIAVHAHLEELLRHHRECPKCLQRRFAVMQDYSPNIPN
jgi:hypothetical protein